MFDDDRFFCRERREKKSAVKKKGAKSSQITLKFFDTHLFWNWIRSSQKLKTTRSKPILNKKELGRSNKMMMMCVRCCVIIHLVLHFSTTLLLCVVVVVVVRFFLLSCVCVDVSRCVCVLRDRGFKNRHTFLTSFFSIKHKKYRHLLFLFFF